ncbi:TIGR02300 family protein [Polycladidibacter stylochi]|uniref:TIGR02300 family protein n=1 Tax=Polycladidibacter stylochi TaxID=1807766 RepID=UPI0008336A91|nr:TIGR02300 family protein [Pseudovibrio stylochi]
MARPELGTKRTCAGCGAKYYDLDRDPIICPKCGEMYDLGITVKTAKAAKSVKEELEEELETTTPANVELVSLEDAEDDDDSAEDIPDLGDDDIETDLGDDDSDVFLEEDDEEDAAVPGIVVHREDDES